MRECGRENPDYRAGILKYDIDDSTCPPPLNMPLKSNQPKCKIENQEHLKPVFQWDEVPYPHNEKRITHLLVTHHSEANDDNPHPFKPTDQLWYLKDDDILVANWSQPSIDKLIKDEELAPTDAPVYVDGTDKDWYYFFLHNIGTPVAAVGFPFLCSHSQEKFMLQAILTL